VFQQKLIKQSMEKDNAGHDRRGILHDETDEDDDSCKLEVVDSVKPGENDRVRQPQCDIPTLEMINQPHPPPKLAVRHINKPAVVLPVRYCFEDDLGVRYVVMAREGPPIDEPVARSCISRRSRNSGPCDGNYPRVGCRGSELGRRETRGKRLVEPPPLRGRRGRDTLLRVPSQPRPLKAGMKKPHWSVSCSDF
jgi:hypothetical protein